MASFTPFSIAGLFLLATLSTALPSPQTTPTATNPDTAAAAASSAAVASQFAAIASNAPSSNGGLTSGDVGNDPSKWSDSNSNAGASGTNTGFVGVSSGAQTAIIVVVVLVAVGGIASAILFYLAKKRQWKVRQSLRRSARRLTGTFKPTTSSSSRPNPQSSSRKQPGLARIPETPQLAPAPKGRSALKVNTSASNPGGDIEKAEKSKVQMSTFEISPNPAKAEGGKGEGKSWRESLWVGKGMGR